MPEEHELAEIAGRLRRAVAPALDLAHPDPEAVRLATLADQIARRNVTPRQLLRHGCFQIAVSRSRNPLVASRACSLK